MVEGRGHGEGMKCGGKRMGDGRRGRGIEILNVLNNGKKSRHVANSNSANEYHERANKRACHGAKLERMGPVE